GRVLRDRRGGPRAQDRGDPARLLVAHDLLPQPRHRAGRGPRRRRALGAAGPQPGLYGAWRHPPRAGRGGGCVDAPARGDARDQPGGRPGPGGPRLGGRRPDGRGAEDLAM
ncbi:MAG: hypothetical protein AVDCRST_MAG01-01-3592, partial [uncultured Rubrobacteraceae bacterium]